MRSRTSLATSAHAAAISSRSAGLIGALRYPAVAVAAHQAHRSA
jgi:hypothetical protein